MQMKTAFTRISVWPVLKWSVVFLGCMLGADALARLGTLHLSLFDAGQLLVAVAVIAFLPVAYRVPVSGITFGVAAVVGVARTVSIVANALVDGDVVPIPRDAYVVQAVVYGIYIALYIWLRHIAKGRTTKTAENE
jgi:hypothetical protein